MGLSGNTRKTKIPDDPRNTKWANDVSAPGFRLLSSMGWTPASPSLGLAASQDLITAGGSRAFSKKISVIPIAKDDNLGIGARRGAGSGGMRAMGLPMMLGGSAGMGFVTAAPVVRDDDGVVVPQIAIATSGGGGEFGRLLERLNAANSARNSATPEVEEVVEEEAKEETKAERKARKLKKKELKRKRSADDEDSVAETIPEAVIEPVVVALDPNALSTMLLRNPRMAARSKHLRAKRMAISSNAAAMAEILGIAPPLSGSSSPATASPHSPASLSPGPFSIPVSLLPTVTNNEVKGEDGWPTPPPRAFPVFASSSTTRLAATFTAAPIVEESEREITKRQKKERKEARQVKREDKAAKKAGSSVVEVPKVSYPAFTSSSSTTLAATFDIPAVVEGKVLSKAEEKEEKKRAKKALKAGVVDMEVDGPIVEGEVVEKKAKKPKKIKTI